MRLKLQQTMHWAAAGDLGLMAWTASMRMSDVFWLTVASVLAVAWWQLKKRRSGTFGRGLQLPPGPPPWPIVGNLFQIDFRPESFMRTIDALRERYGPIIKLRVGRRTMVIVTSAELIHEALVRRGATFAARPPDGPIHRLFTADKSNVSSATYGPLWRALRRNMASGLVSAPRLRGFAAVRDRAVERHLASVRDEFRRNGAVRVIDGCRIAVSSVLVTMTFGAVVPEGRVRDILDVMADVATMMHPSLLDSFPMLAPLLRKKFAAARSVRARQVGCLMPLVEARREFLLNNNKGSSDPAMEMVVPAGEAYVDSLFELETPPAPEKENGASRRLTDGEIVSLCAEVIIAGTDTTSSGVEWAMMHLVLDPDAQDRLHAELALVSDGQIEDDARVPFLRAVVKETLRFHPPTKFLLAHAVTEETELGGYRVPADAVVDFYTTWVPHDPEAWDDPIAWRPERFLGDGADAELVVAGGGTLRMLPFGAGRRVCPGAALGTLHLRLMIAAMVREFRWVPVPGDDPPDPTETSSFPAVMKNSLRAAIVERKAREHAL